MSSDKGKMSSQRSDELQSVLIRRMEEEPKVAKRKTMLLQEGDVVLGGEGPVRKTETPAPKPRRKPPTEDGGEGRRRRKPKPIVEVNSTFTDLRRLLQDMRPSTLQVLRTPYYRNCKAARNMRKGVRQIREFCKQVRLETVMLSKKKGDEIPKKRRKPEVSTSPLAASASKTGADLDVGSPSHSTDGPSHSTEKRSTVTASRDESHERTKPEPSKPKGLMPKTEILSPALRERERDRSPKRERIKSPMEKDRERERSPKRERDKSPKKEKSPPKREREREREKSPRRGREKDRDRSPFEIEKERERFREREREVSPKLILKKPKLEMAIDLEDSLGNSDDSE